MGRKIDLDKPLSEEDKQYLRDRGRHYLIPANERRFGVDGKRQPEEHELAGAAAQSPFYDTDERAKAVYDVGGAPLPGTVLDTDTGRVADRENGVLVEPTVAGPGQQAYDPRKYVEEGFGSASDDDDDIDQDIVEYVLALEDDDLTAVLDHYELEAAAEDAREEDGTVTPKRQLDNETLAVYLQDQRDAGKAIDLSAPEKE